MMTWEKGCIFLAVLLLPFLAFAEGWEGDFLEDEIVHFTFHTTSTAAVPTVLAGTPVISVYKDNVDTTEKTSAEAYITLDTAHDAIVGSSAVTIDLSGDAFFAIGANYSVIITTGTVGGVSVVGAEVATFSIENRFDEVNLTQINGSATPVPNLEDMYDGTGYLDDTAPASRSLVDGISISTGGATPHEALDDNVLAPIKTVPFVGVQASGTFASTEAVDGVYHQLTDTGNTIDIVYSFTVSAARQAVEVVFTGRLNSGNDSMSIQAYDFNGTDWETRWPLAGKNGTSDDNIVFNLLKKHTGTGADLGKVLIRFVGGNSSPVLFVDEILVLAGKGEGSDFTGLVWVDTIGGTAGTAEGVGLSSTPSSNMTDALAIATAHGQHEFRMVAGSAVTLPSNFDTFTTNGHGYSVDLNGQSVSGSVFNGAEVIGSDDGSNTKPTLYNDCLMTTNTIGLHEFRSCEIKGTVTFAEAGDYNWFDCKSGIPGSNTPGVDFGVLVGSTNFGARAYWGGLEFKQMGQVGTDVASFDCSAGQVIFASSCVLGNVRRAGMHALTDNSATVIIAGGNGMTIATNASGLISGIDGTITDFDGLNNFDPTSDPVLLAATATSPQLVDDFWDEPLTGPTHNVGDSGAKRLRNFEDFGRYSLASVWVNEAAGTSTGTEDFEDATDQNRSTDFDNAITVLTSLKLDRVHIQNADTITLTASLAGCNVWGDNWALALGGQDIDSSTFTGASVSGIATGTTPKFIDCTFDGATTLAPAQIYFSGIAATFTLGSAGDFRFVDCRSDVAGPSAPTFDFGAAVGSTTAEFRRWSGGWTGDNIQAGDVISVDVVSGGTITINGTGGTVQVRGICNVVDGSGGSVTINDLSTLNQTELATALTDYDGPTNTEMLAAHSATDALIGGIADPWVTALPGAYIAGSAGYILGTNLDVPVSSVSGGSGLTIVNHDTGGADTLTYRKSGVGVQDASISAFVKTEFDSNPLTAPVRASVRTDADGRFASNMFLTAGVEYTLVYLKPGLFGPDYVDVTP